MEIRRQIYHQIRHVYRRIRRVKTWQLLIILVLSGFITLNFLRLNNVGMLQLRNSVLAADKAGKDGDIATRLYDLQRYAAAHMNADTGQFYLENQYRRDAQKVIDAATNDSNPNGNVNAKAEAICRERYPSYREGTYLQYQQCFIDEMSKFPSAPSLEDKVTLPNAALYLHSFVSPLWSRDFAGFSALFFLVVALIIIGRWLHLGFLYLLLKLRYKAIGS